jgi:hypothetical protein
LVRRIRVWVSLLLLLLLLLLSAALVASVPLLNVFEAARARLSARAIGEWEYSSKHVRQQPPRVLSLSA